MKTSIEVKDRGEGLSIKAALADPTVRAFVVVMGVLLPLDVVDRRRVLAFVQDKFQSDREL